MFATSANAQVKFGLKGGLNVTSMSFSEDVFDASNKTGFFVGPMVKVTVPIVGLSFDAAALYDQKEADVKYNIDGELGKTTVRQKSINIPVNVRYGFGLSSLANAFLFAGPQWGINVGDKNFKWNETSSYSLKKSNFSVNVGAGVTLLSHLQISPSRIRRFIYKFSPAVSSSPSIRFMFSTAAPDAPFPRLSNSAVMIV